MKGDEKRNGRIHTLYKMARTGRYNWDQLMNHALATGITKDTAKSYLAAVRAQLKKEGLI